MLFSLDKLRNTQLKIHIVGAAAVEGAAIARFLAKLGATNVVLHDFCEQKDLAKRFLTFHNGVKNKAQLWQQMKNLPYTFHFADQYLSGIEEAELIFINQAWYKYDCNFPKLGQIVAEQKIPLSSMMDLYLQLFPGKIIGVTGTHGKTTVTRLLGHVLANCGLSVYVSGNDRHSDQILDRLAEPESFSEADWLVLEISNRQLKLPYPKGPDIAVITNIYPNHLDEHVDLAEYRATKERIADNQPAGGKLIVGDNDQELVAWAKDRGGLVVDQSVLEGVRSQFQVPLTLRGEHNLYNLALVIQIATELRIAPADLQSALNSFPGVEKRMQKVYQNDQVIVINDLASTTPQATLAAVKAYADYPTIVILGGDDKNIPLANWQSLSEALTNAQVYVLPGSLKDKIALKKATYLQDWPDLLEALSEWKNTKNVNQKETVILLSPAGEGFYTRFLQRVNLKRDLEAIFAPQSVSE